MPMSHAALLKKESNLLKFETWYHHKNYKGLQSVIPPPQSSQCWDYKYAPRGHAPLSAIKSHTQSLTLLTLDLVILYSIVLLNLCNCLVDLSVRFPLEMRTLEFSNITCLTCRHVCVLNSCSILKTRDFASILNNLTHTIELRRQLKWLLYLECYKCTGI